MKSDSCALNITCSLASLQEVATAADMEYAFPMCQRGVNLYANVKPTGMAYIVHWPNYVPYLWGSASVSAAGWGDNANTPGLTYVFNISLS